MAKPLEQRVKDAIGSQAWTILALQQTCDEQAEKIKALEATIAEQAPKKPPTSA
jgi:hypothetical protein